MGRFLSALSALLAAAMLLAGCIVPIHEVSEGAAVTEQDLRLLRVGETDRAQVLARFGAPDLDHVDARTIAYSWTGSRGRVLVGAEGGGAQIASMTTRRALRIGFDSSDKVATYSIVERPGTAGPYRAEDAAGQAQGSGVALVVLRFRTDGPLPEQARSRIAWVFAVANEWTGWEFRQLERPAEEANAPDSARGLSGWLTFVAPPGTSYLAATTYGGPAQGALDTFHVRAITTATPYADRISVEPQSRRTTPGTFSSFMLGSSYGVSYLLDFIDEPRLAVQAPEGRSVIYAGTIIATLRCRDSSSLCAYDLTVADESALARSFVARHPDKLPLAAPMHTRLLTIPQSRTIEIRGQSTMW